MRFLSPTQARIKPDFCVLKSTSRRVTCRDVTGVTRWGFLKRSAPDVMVRLCTTFVKSRAHSHAEHHIRMGTRLCNVVRMSSHLGAEGHGSQMDPIPFWLRIHHDGAVKTLCWNTFNFC